MHLHKSKDNPLQLPEPPEILREPQTERQIHNKLHQMDCEPKPNAVLAQLRRREVLPLCKRVPYLTKKKELI
jgi:hypothetical protein